VRAQAAGDPAAIEWERGQQVDAAKHEVHEADHERHLADHRRDPRTRSTRNAGDADEQHACRQAHERAGDGRKDLVARSSRLERRTRRAAEKVDDQGADRHAGATSDECVAQLMGERRHEEQERRGETHRPAGDVAGRGLEIADLGRDRHRDDGEDQRPRHVDPDLEAEESSDRQRVHRAASDRTGGASARGSAGPWPVVRAAMRIVETRATTAARAMQTTPTAMAVSCQKANGKSWTSRSVEGSNR
jgi:hypothetical protein